MHPPKTAVHRWAGPTALILGLLLAQAVVYLSTGWRDGYLDPGLWSLKWHFLRYLPWTLALAAGAGWLLEGFHRRWLAKALGKPLTGWPVLVAIVRLFLLFPFYGFIVLFQFIFGFILGVGRGLLSKARQQPAPPAAPEQAFMSSTALWLLLGPMAGMTDTEGNILAFELTSADLAGRAVRLLPWLLLILWVWTGAEGEDSGERVNAFWLSLAGMVWLGDFILLTWLNRPHWLRRV